jgi:hypothetical protein
MTKKFRPQEFSKVFKLKNNPIGQWHWHEHRHLSTHFERMAAQLHYLSSHAPAPIRKKWAHVWKKFEQKYRNKL